MRAFAVFAIVLALSSADDVVHFADCPDADNSAVVQTWSLTVGPDPIIVQEGKTARIHFDATIKDGASIPVGSKVAVKLTKDRIPIPCLTVSHAFLSTNIIESYFYCLIFRSKVCPSRSAHVSMMQRHCLDCSLRKCVRPHSSLLASLALCL